VKKIFSLLLVELTIPFLLLVIFPSILIREGIGQFIEGGKPILSLQKRKSYQQPINNITNSLNSISLQLKNPAIQDNSQITIELLDELGSPLNIFTLYGSNIGDPGWIKLDFPPISETNLILKVYSETSKDDSLYLFANENGDFDLKTTYLVPNIFSRIKENILLQINLISNRSLLHNLVYVSILIFLNIYIIKLLHEK
jgi:hypothetical protein